MPGHSISSELFQKDSQEDLREDSENDGLVYGRNKEQNKAMALMV